MTYRRRPTVCDCGQKATTRLVVFLGFPGNGRRAPKPETIPLCPDCAALERQQQREWDAARGEAHRVVMRRRR